MASKTFFILIRYTDNSLQNYGPLREGPRPRSNAHVFSLPAPGFCRAAASGANMLRKHPVCKTSTQSRPVRTSGRRSIRPRGADEVECIPVSTPLSLFGGYDIPSICGKIFKTRNVLLFFIFRVCQLFRRHFFSGMAVFLANRADRAIQGTAATPVVERISSSHHPIELFC